MYLSNNYQSVTSLKKYIYKLYLNLNFFPNLSFSILVLILENIGLTLLFEVLFRAWNIQYYNINPLPTCQFPSHKSEYC